MGEKKESLESSTGNPEYYQSTKTEMTGGRQSRCDQINTNMKEPMHLQPHESRKKISKRVNFLIRTLK